MRLYCWKAGNASNRRWVGGMALKANQDHRTRRNRRHRCGAKFHPHAAPFGVPLHHACYLLPTNFAPRCDGTPNKLVAPTFRHPIHPHLLSAATQDTPHAPREGQNATVSWPTTPAPHAEFTRNLRARTHIGMFSAAAGVVYTVRLASVRARAGYHAGFGSSGRGRIAAAPLLHCRTRRLTPIHRSFPQSALTLRLLVLTVVGWE